MTFNQGNKRAAKLSNEVVLEILDKYHNKGQTQGQLAREYDVTVNTIGRIVRRETHQRVMMPVDVQASAEQLAAFQASLPPSEALERLQQAIAKEKPTTDSEIERQLNDFERASIYGADKP
jgi:transposase-like protein